MFNLINLSLSQLTYYYSHLGFSRTSSIYLLKKYFLGFYYNITIINLNYSIFFLKSNLSILLNISLKNGRLLVFSENVNFLKLKEKYLFKFFNIYYCLKRWYPGLFTHFKIFFEPFNIKKKQYIFLKSLPDIIIILSYNNYYSIGNLMKETKKLLLPSINLIDSIHKPIYIDYFILLNIKNLYSSIFYMNFFKQIIFKCNFLKRKLFFQKLVTLIFKKIINEITI